MFIFEDLKDTVIQRSRELIEHYIQARGHDHPPFIPEEMASLVGVTKILKTDLGTTSGLLIRMFRKTTIKLNINHTKTRQNFSCAHEIGHIFFTELGLDRYTKSVEARASNPAAGTFLRSQIIEKLCDAAATELLMPGEQYKKYLDHFGPSIETIERLANTFQVSLQAAAIRVSEMPSSKSLVFKWRKKIPSKDSIFLDWPKVVIVEKTAYSPKVSSVKAPSTFHKAYESGMVHKTKISFRVGSKTEKLPIEMKAFGHARNRYLLSLVTRNTNEEK